MHNAGCQQCFTLADKASCCFARHPFARSTHPHSFSPEHPPPGETPDNHLCFHQHWSIHLLFTALIEALIPTSPSSFSARGIHYFHCTKWGVSCVLQEAYPDHHFTSAHPAILYFKNSPFFPPSISNCASKPDMIATKKAFINKDGLPVLQSPWSLAYTTQPSNLTRFIGLLRMQHH